MALQKQNVPIKIGSLDTLTDLRQLPPGALSLVENMVRRQGGALEKRYGASALSALGSSSNRKLFAFGDEMVAVSDVSGAGAIDLRSYSSTRNLWSLRATWQNCLPKVRDVYSSEFAQTCHDVAVNGSYALSAWEDSSASNTVLFRVIDLASGSVLLESSVASANKPHCAKAGTYLLLFYADSAGTNLKVKKIDTSGAGALSVASTTTVATNFHANQAYDVTGRLDVSRVAIAYHSTVPDVKLVDWNPATDTATTTTSVAGQLSDRCCGWLTADWNTASVFVGIADSANGVKLITVTRATFAAAATTAIDATATDVRNITGYYDGTTSFTFFELNAATAYNVRTRISSNAGAPSDLMRSCGLAAKTMKIDTQNHYATLLTYDSPTQKTYFVLAGNNFAAPSARILAGNGGGLTAKRSALSASGSFGNLFVMAALRATRLDVLGKSFVVQSNPVILSLDFGPAIIPMAKELGNTLFLPGGMLNSYDIKYDRNSNNVLGESIASLAPEDPVLTPGGGGSMTASGVYQYKAVYCTVDNHGRIRRSAESNPITTTLSAVQNSVSVAVPTLRVSAQPYTVELYRTVAGGAAFYRVQAFGATANSTIVDTVTINDTLADATLETQERLYTDSGELSNYAPPSLRHTEVYRSRLVGISAEDPRAVFYSKEIMPGVGIGFHPDLQLRLEGDDGEAYALAVMDDKLVAFKKNSVYVTAGDGPDNRGQGNTLPPFSLVSRNVGTTEPESVVLTPNGVMFRSAKGFYLFTRGLEIQYIGAPVDAYNSLDITAAVLVENASQIRWTTTSGRTLVYDYVWSEWYTFTGQAAISAVNYGGKFTYVLSTGSVLQEDTSVFSDAGAAIAQAVELAPLAAAGVSGWERIYEVYLEGEYLSSGTLSVKVAYDYGSTNSETLTLALGTVQVDNQYRVRARFARRNCEAVRLRIEESSTGQAFSLASVTAIVGVKPGKGGRIPAANAAT